MTKKRKTKKRSKKRVGFWQKYKKSFSILVVVVLAAFLIYGSFDTVKSLFTVKKHTEKKTYPSKELLAKMNKMLKEEKEKVDILKKELTKIKKSQKRSLKTPKKAKKLLSSEAVDYKKSLEKYDNIKPEQTKTTLFVHSKKPLLAIIIDDVAFNWEVNKIKALPFKVTPSFFPPTKRHPNTPKLANEFDFYMVHLPLEALHYPHPEPKTLLTIDSLDTINNRIQNIKKWFPRDKFLNNHTGSKFTSDYDSMMKLYTVLDRYNLVFIDSRTSADTVASKVAANFHKKLLSRDVFIDNIADITYIQKQLKKAVAKAKQKGFAIAIGHPHPKTLQALKISAALLKDVKLVYIGTIYAKLKTNPK
jgi:polysaccharide deacetylase 2 family uncharacterized protein YibQ